MATQAEMIKIGNSSKLERKVKAVGDRLICFYFSGHGGEGNR